MRTANCDFGFRGTALDLQSKRTEAAIFVAQTPDVLCGINAPCSIFVTSYMYLFEYTKNLAYVIQVLYPEPVKAALLPVALFNAAAKPSVMVSISVVTLTISKPWAKRLAAWSPLRPAIY